MSPRNAAPRALDTVAAGHRGESAAPEGLYHAHLKPGRL